MSKRRHSHSRRHTQNRHTQGGHTHGGYSGRVPQTRNLPGKLIVLIQLLMTLIFIAAVWTSA